MSLFDAQPEQIRTLNRLNACLFTTRCAINELEDPKDPEQRADLLFLSETLLSEVMRLNDVVREMVWSDLDKKAHPSSSQDV
jgi:hypothetical protein